MGTYRVVTQHWPEPRDPEIVVTGGFIEFYVTAIDQLLSRTIFLYLEVLWMHFTEFLVRTMNNNIRFFHFLRGYFWALLELPTFSSLFAKYSAFFCPLD